MIKTNLKSLDKVLPWDVTFLSLPHGENTVFSSVFSLADSMAGVFVGRFFGTPRNRISVFCRDTALDKVKTNGSVIVCGRFISMVR